MNRIAVPVDKFQTLCHFCEMTEGAAAENELLIDHIELWRTLRVFPREAREFVRALAVKDLSAPGGGLPPALDAIWHRSLLETQAYQRLCECLRGRPIHHSTTTAADADDVTRQSRVDATVLAYRKRYREEPDPALWDDGLVVEEREQEPVFQLFVKSTNGKLVTIGAKASMTIRALKELVEIKSGISADQQQFVYGGRALGDDRTCEYYGITAVATLHQVLNLKGC